jgi:acyl-coenzyme A synthetase/AMP-(fatty) acid ligase/acyl carrier protein
MNDSLNHGFSLPPEQQAIRDKCFHPSGTFVEFPMEDVETSIPARFEKIVLRNPNRIALKTDSYQITYDELNCAANRLAHRILARRGNGQEAVAVFVRGALRLIIAYLAVFKAGKIALRQSLANIQLRTEQRTKDSFSGFAVTDNETSSSIRDRLGSDITLCNMDDRCAPVSEENPGVFISPLAPAYIKYTSGSSGQAKGFVKSHRYALHTVRNFVHSLHICADDRLALIGRSSVFNDILTGATLFPMDLNESGFSRLAEWLIAEEITVYRSFPTAFRNCITTLSGQERFPSLRAIRLGGEVLFKRDVELYRKYFSANCLLINSYGSTETGAICHYYIDKDSEIESHCVPVGYPLDGLDVSVVDENGVAKQTNSVGEIVVKSSFLPTRYLPDREYTAEDINLPASDGVILAYNTRDLGRLLEDGCLVHLGRMDSQVKVRGLRVDIAEVESVIADHPGVKAAAVSAQENVNAEVRIVGYIVPRSKSALDVSDINAFLRDRLPDHMIPSNFLFLDSLPLTNGKLDRRALPKPDNRRPNLKAQFVAPRSEVEKKLADIWSVVLVIDPIGVEDNFFDLGGHSLTASQVITRVLTHFRLDLSIKALFDSPTVAEMAAIIEQNQAKRANDAELAQMLCEVEAMTEEEAQKSLAVESAQGSKGNGHE